MNALADRWPELARQLPRRPIAELPTALEPAARLGAAIGVHDLLTKRDDRSGAMYGGNKVRKLEYLLGDALGLGCDAVLTYGAVGSNHALATAIYAQQAGLTCYAALADQVRTPYIASTLRWHALLGTRVIAAADFAGIQQGAARVRAEHSGGPERIYEIPWGGSSVPGTVGFVAAGLEIAPQLAALSLTTPVRIYLPCGTMGTIAGLALGLRIAGVDATVVGVKVVPQNVVTPEAIARLCGATNSDLQRRDPAFPLVPEPLARVEFRTGFLGEGYAYPTPECQEAVRLAQDLEGFRVDTTYSGKALACLIADARSGRLTGQTPVFWQTYNSRPYPAGLATVDTSRLPDAVRKFLDG